MTSALQSFPFAPSSCPHPTPFAVALHHPSRSSGLLHFPSISLLEGPPSRIAATIKVAIALSVLVQHAVPTSGVISALIGKSPVALRAGMRWIANTNVDANGEVMVRGGREEGCEDAGDVWLLRAFVGPLVLFRQRAGEDRKDWTTSWEHRFDVANAASCATL
ncbi:hypothetical protein AB1N83_009432 [Pleurotus pulmonarius]|nr:hypothetical protein EYR36_009972 [Pleurotus pulmonarius]KAF4593450.1 hypothetical protein EYR38_009164 [Pleurotus pulmonarius]